MAKEISKNSEYIRFDWAIKRILRDKTNFEVLEGLASVLLKQKVTITGLIESESNKDRREDKGNRVDVKALMQNGEQIIVEVQLSRESDFFQRILFGTATSIYEQIGMGQEYEKIHKVYSINVLYFNLGSGEDYAYHGETVFRGITNEDAVLTLNNENEQKYLTNTTKPITSPGQVFPEYFLLIVDRFNEVAKTPIEEWMAYLKDGIINDDTKEPGLLEARKKLEYMSMSEQERREYRDYMISVHAAKDVVDTARADGIVEGFTEGYGQGKEDGIKEGIEKGIEKGKEQAEQKALQERVESARLMKSDGLPLATIAKYTGLTESEVAIL